MYTKFLLLFALFYGSTTHAIIGLTSRIVTSNAFLNPLSFGTTVAFKGPRIENNWELNRLEQAKQYAQHPDTLKATVSSAYSLLIATMACKHPKIMQHCKTFPRLLAASSIISLITFKVTELSIDQVRKHSSLEQNLQNIEK